MTLFERIQNKRYDLQEGVDDKKNITPNPGDAAKEKSILRNYNKKQKKFNQTNVTSSGRVKATSDILKTSGDASKTQKDFAKKFSPQNLSKTLAKTTSDPKGETLVKGTSDEKLIRTTKPTGDEGQFRRNAKRKITGDVIPKKDLPKTKGVNQADVSKKAKDFTKKINKQRIVKQKNIFGGEDTVKTKKKTSSTTSSTSKTKTPTVQGQKKLNLGTYTKGKVQPTQTLKPGGVIKTDLRTVAKKTRSARKRSPLAKPPKPEKMVTVKDPIKGGFKEVGATTKQGRKVIKTKQSISTDELLGNQKKIKKKIVNNTKNIKNTPKPNLFSRIKGKIKGFHKFMVKDAGYRQTSGSGKMLPDSLGVLAKDKNISRNIYKNTLRGNTLKNINKVLPGKYKALAALALTGYALTRGKKNTGGGVVGGGPKVYTGVNPGLKLDKTGSKKK